MKDEGAAEYCRVAGVEGPGDAAGAADVNTIVPAGEAGTGLRQSAWPWGPHGTQSAAGVNHVAACGFISGVPLAAVTPCLHRAVTSERAIRAGPIADMPCICNSRRAAAPDGSQPFLPVGATAVNPGLQRGWGHSLSGAAAASRSCFPAALRGSWLRHGSAVWMISSAVARARWFPGIPDPLLETG